MGPRSIDRGMLADLRESQQFRLSQDATVIDRFLCSQLARSKGKPIDRRKNTRKRFKAACRCLGRERVAELTIHHGRHSFVSHALHGGRSPAEVQQAADDASLAVTTIYAHLVDEDEQVGNIVRLSAGLGGRAAIPSSQPTVYTVLRGGW